MSRGFFARHFFLWRVPDYLIIIVIAIIAAAVGAKVRPNCRLFEWTDPSINYPHAPKDTFPMYSVVIAVVFVALVYLIGELCTKWHRPVGKLNMCLHLNGWIITHLYSIFLAFVFVNVSKTYAGRLRPDFLARLALENITQANFDSYTHDQICHAAREGRLSFPSGHSGTAFAGFVPPCLYLMGLMRAFKGSRVWLATIALFPLILPVAVAVSRTVDYRHDFDDAFVGSICGSVCGIFAVLINFRVSLRGEWTLRDHPDDHYENVAWLREMLNDENDHIMVTVEANDDGSEESEDDERSSSDEDASPSAPASKGKTSHQQRDRNAVHLRPRLSGSAPPTSPASGFMNDANCASPAAPQDGTANSSPSIRHRDKSLPARKGHHDRSGGGGASNSNNSTRYKSKEKRGRRERLHESTGSAAVVEFTL